MWQVLEKTDVAIFYLVNKSSNALFDFLMPFISNVKNFYVPIGLLWIFLITRKNLRSRSVALCIILVIFLSDWVSSGVLKPMFDRPRPYHSLSGVRLYNTGSKIWSVTPELKEPVKGQSRSLPSTHATNMFAASLLLSYCYWKWWPFFYLAAFAVAYSRLYLGVHYPADVCLGAVVGTVCGILGVWLIGLAGRFLEARGYAFK